MQSLDKKSYSYHCSLYWWSDHISPVNVLQLHWLPVRQRVVFKIATLVRSNCLHAPGYLADMEISASHRRSSKTTAFCWHKDSQDTDCMSIVHRTRSCFGDRTFAAAARKSVEQFAGRLTKGELSYSRFRRSLKAFLFRKSDHGELWTFLF